MIDPAIPVPKNLDWSPHPIDRFVIAKLEAAEITPNDEADRLTLVRRLYFDLLGLPPAPEEIDRFVQDESPHAYERLVDQLLASPHFGERWGRHWLDVVRYGESLTLRGFIMPDAWRYRDYVIEAFNDDRPFDQFLREQLAGDLMPADSLKARQRQLVATTFFALGNTNLEEQEKRQLDMDVVDEQLDTIGKAMLGQTIGCARCHDHKFDPIPTRDYYALAGILRNSQQLEHENISKWMEVPLPLPADEEDKIARHEALVDSKQKQIDELKATIAKLEPDTSGQGPAVVAASDLPGIVVDDQQAKKVGEWKVSQHTKRYIDSGYLHDDNTGKGEKTLTFVPALPRNGKYEVRFAYSHAPGRAKNVPVTVFSADGERMIQIDQRKPPPIDARFVSLGEYYCEQAGQSFVLVATDGASGHVTADAVQFIPRESDDAKPTAVAAATVKPDTTERTAKEAELATLQSDFATLEKSAPKRPKVMTVVERKEVTDSPIHIRGSVHSLGEAVPRGFLQVATIGPAPTVPSNQSGRLQLADWVASRTNPLPARVYANRVWHWLFGQGLMRTTDNFGATGEEPSHPELLDYLATRLMNDGWSTKKLIRYIVLSKTYRLASADNAAAHTRDPENRLLWRMNRKRLEAECIRDAMLLVSGQLDRQAGGNTIKPGTTSDYAYREFGNRRSVYLPVFRNALPELFEAFDFADPSLVVGRRNQSTVATQALFLMNDPFVLEQSRAAAKRALADQSKKVERLELAFLRTLGRPPTADEKKIAEQILDAARASQNNDEDAWTALYHALFASVDFRYRN